MMANDQIQTGGGGWGHEIHKGLIMYICTDIYTDLSQDVKIQYRHKHCHKHTCSPEMFYRTGYWFYKITEIR